MKRIPLILLAILIIPVIAYGVAGDDTTVMTRFDSVTGGPIVLTFTTTADSDGGNVSNHTVYWQVVKMLKKQGYYFWKARTNPGTAPTDNYDITVLDSNSNDIANSLLLNRDTTTTEAVQISPAEPLTSNVLTITVSNNSNNSAVIVLELYFAK